MAAVTRRIGIRDEPWTTSLPNTNASATAGSLATITAVVPRGDNAAMESFSPVVLKTIFTVVTAA